MDENRQSDHHWRTLQLEAMAAEELLGRMAEVTGEIAALGEAGIALSRELPDITDLMAALSTEVGRVIQALEAEA